jgi:hypothetical protein
MGLVIRNVHRLFGLLLYPCLVLLLIISVWGLFRLRRVRSWSAGGLLCLLAFFTAPPVVLWLLNGSNDGNILSGKRIGSELLLSWYVAHLFPVVPAAMAAWFVSRARRKRQPVG